MELIRLRFYIIVLRFVNDWYSVHHLTKKNAIEELIEQIVERMKER